MTGYKLLGEVKCASPLFGRGGGGGIGLPIGEVVLISASVFPSHISSVRRCVPHGAKRPK